MKKQKITTLGKVIKIKLIEKDMTQKELAEKIDVSNVYLNQIISGQRSGKKYLDAIVRELDIDLSKVLQDV